MERMVEAAIPRSLSRFQLTGWSLFWTLATPLLGIEFMLVTLIDWSSPVDIRWLMGMNWRLAAPYFLLTFAASPVYRLFPGRISRWLISNRRYLGLAFAVGALCQLVPISVLAFKFHPAMADIHSVSSQFGEDVIYTILALMTLTSFRAPSRFLSKASWRACTVPESICWPGCMVSPMCTMH